MTGSGAGWLLGVCCFLIFWIAQLLYFKIFYPTNRIGFLLRAPVILVPTVFFAAYYFYPHFASNILPEGRVMQMITSVGVFTIFFIFTLLFYAAVDHSVRIRLVVELFKKNGGPLSFEEITSHYKPHEAMANRLNQLVHGGYITVENDRIHMTKKGQSFAAGGAWLKNFFRMGLGG